MHFWACGRTDARQTEHRTLCKPRWTLPEPPAPPSAQVARHHSLGTFWGLAPREPRVLASPDRCAHHRAPPAFTRVDNGQADGRCGHHYPTAASPTPSRLPARVRWAPLGLLASTARVAERAGPGSSQKHSRLLWFALASLPAPRRRHQGVPRGPPLSQSPLHQRIQPICTNTKAAGLLAIRGSRAPAGVGRGRPGSC